MVIESFNISKSFNNNKALDEVSFSIPEGSLSLLAGPNGAGKTTLLRIILKELFPTKGEVKYLFNPSTFAFSDENRDVFENFTPLQYCRLWQLLYPRFDKENFLKMVSERSIHFNRDVAHLSKGKKTWLLNALVLASNSPVILFDEPLQYLDPLIREEFKKTLLKEKEKKRTLFISTHEIAEFQDITDYIVILCEGHLLYQGEKEKTCMTHRVIPGTDPADNCKVIGPIVNEKLVLTEKNIGRKPVLKDIVVGYLNGYHVGN